MTAWTAWGPCRHGSERQRRAVAEDAWLLYEAGGAEGKAPRGSSEIHRKGPAEGQPQQGHARNKRRAEKGRRRGAIKVCDSVRGTV